MLRSALVAVTALAAVASAQNTTLSTGNTTYFYGTDGSLEIDPTVVSEALRADWCLGQTNNCPEVCDGQTTVNTCDRTTLDWTCTCSDSSLKPNITNYAAMMPSYVCQEWKSLCVDAHPNDAIGQEGCNSVTCGMQNASATSTSSSSSSSTSSSAGSSSTSASATTGGASGSSTSATSSATSTDTGAAAALNVAQAYGSSILAAGLLGIFGLAL